MYFMYFGLQLKYLVLVLEYFSKYLYLYPSTFENSVLVLVLVFFSSTCTCTRVVLSSIRPKPGEGVYTSEVSKLAPSIGTVCVGVDTYQVGKISTYEQQALCVSRWIHIRWVK